MDQLESLDCGEHDADLFDLQTLDPSKIDNQVLSEALARIKERCIPDAHADYFTKHSSHSKYSKGW